MKRKPERLIARFWAHVNNGWVKLTLRPDECIEHREGGPHDEGYSVTHVLYSTDGSTVVREAYTNSSDCDGRTSSATIVECRVRNLSSRESCEGYAPYPGAMLPAWEVVHEEQRDYAAERAGY